MTSCYPSQRPFLKSSYRIFLMSLGFSCSLISLANANTLNRWNTQASLGSGMTFAAGIAVDTSGNVYVTDRANNNVYKLTPSGATYTQSTLLTGFNDPKSIAVDNSENLYITDSGNGNVVKATLSGGTYSRSNIITGIGGLNGVACNSTGSTVYVTKNGSGAGVIRGVLSGGVYGTTTIASAGLNNPMEVTADSSNNVYIADFYGNKIFKETYNAGSYSQSQIDSGGAQCAIRRCG